MALAIDLPREPITVRRSLPKLIYPAIMIALYGSFGLFWLFFGTAALIAMPFSASLRANWFVLAPMILIGLVFLYPVLSFWAVWFDMFRRRDFMTLSRAGVLFHADPQRRVFPWASIDVCEIPSPKHIQIWLFRYALALDTGGSQPPGWGWLKWSPKPIWKRRRPDDGEPYQLFLPRAFDITTTRLRDLILGYKRAIEAPAQVQERPKFTRSAFSRF